MSIADRAGAARSFVLAGRSGLDSTFVCTNPGYGDTTSIQFRQSRPTVPGKLSSFNVKCAVGYTDPTTGQVLPVDCNITVRFRNDDRFLDHTNRVEQAVVLAVRSLFPFDAATIVGTAVETNLKNAELGALPASL